MQGKAKFGAALLLGALLVAFAGMPTVARSGSEALAGAPVHLVMVDDPLCHYCRKWHAEIGPGYAKSREGRFAPLKRVERGDSEIRDFAPVVYTPTFIVVTSGREVGRVTGYPGRDFFYGELRGALEAAGFKGG